MRKSGDLGHVDKSRSDDNRRLLGGEGWAQRALDDIRAMAAENHADDLEALERRRRTSEIKRRIAEGPKDPWRPTRHGTLREVILTANKAWFKQIVMVGNSIEFDQLEKLFEERAISWLQENFGDDVIHAWADLDEDAYHVHAVILPKARKTVRGRTRWALEPSKHPLIKDYEAAQDTVGE